MQSGVSKIFILILTFLYLCGQLTDFSVFGMNIYIFNPDNDLALANGDTNYLPPRNVRLMAMDLAMLPAWYSQPSDKVLLPDSEAIFSFSKTLPNHACLFENKWITYSEDISDATFFPWGWNPALVKRLAVRGASSERLPSENVMEAWRQLSSRSSAVSVLSAIKERLGGEHPLIGESWMCHTEAEVASLVDSLPHTMLKAPWSGSGKGLRRGMAGGYRSPLSGWCVRTLERQGAVVVEPLYDNKACDFAMEFYVHTQEKKAEFVGYSLFVTNANGAYEGNILMNDAEIEEYLVHSLPRETLHAVRDVLADELVRRFAPSGYQGYVGVDMMICSSSLLHPCVEINLRMNMGVVSHLLYERWMMPGTRGRFVVEYYPTPEKLADMHHQRMEQHTPVWATDGRICSGYLPLTPIGKQTHYLAAMMVGDEFCI